MVIMMRVAIVDFDGTLYAKETFQILMDHLKEHPVYHTRYKRFFRSILPPYIGHKMKIYPKHKMRERSMQIYLDALKDLSVEEMDTYFREVSAKLQADFNPDIVSKVKQHAADGVHVMLVSGAYTPLLHIAVEGLPFDNIIGTNIPIKNSVIDLKTPILHVQGIGKNEQIETALANKEIDWANSFAYGDSYSDLSVLDLVGNPVAVQPEDQLKAVAKKRKWKII
jgi:HAD superfamily hydrolase (TIGR01490 family)